MRKVISVLMVIMLLSVTAFSGLATAKAAAMNVVSFAETALYRLLLIDPQAQLYTMNPMTFGEAGMSQLGLRGHPVVTSVGTAFVDKGSLEVKQVLFLVPLGSDRSEFNEKINWFFAGVAALEYPNIRNDEAKLPPDQAPISLVVNSTSWLMTTAEQQAEMMNGTSVLLHSSDEWDYKANYLADSETMAISFLIITATARN